MRYYTAVQATPSEHIFMQRFLPQTVIHGADLEVLLMDLGARTFQKAQSKRAKMERYQLTEKHGGCRVIVSMKINYLLG